MQFPPKHFCILLRSFSLFKQNVLKRAEGPVSIPGLEVRKSFRLSLPEQQKQEEIKRRQLWTTLPEPLKKQLLPDLSSKQLKCALKKHSKSRKLPEHFMPPDLTAIPAHGCVKHLSVPLRKKGGRNNTGRITVRHRGGGFKRRLRLLDFARTFKTPHEVVRIEHDPNRSAKIALLQCQRTKELRYVLATSEMKPGLVIENKETPLEGATMELRLVPSGVSVHSIEIRPGKGGQMVRSAGTAAQVVGRNPEKAQVSVKLPSGKVKVLSERCKASVGTVGNADWHLRVIGKAGRNRNLGIRPTVRGVAMNAVDHPHGGGKGGKSKGKPSQSPWGKICK